jgi:hypothetical protein
MMDIDFFYAFALVAGLAYAINWYVKRQPSKKEGGGRKGEDKEQL